MFNGEITWHLKRRLKRLCHYKWKALGTFFLSSTSYFIWEGHKILSCSQVAILWKGMNWKLISLWRKINWYGLQIAKCHFSCSIWLMISEKSIMVYTFLFTMVMCAYTKSLSKQGIHKKLCTRIFNCLNTYIHTERRNFKTFRKENYTIGLIGCYLLNFMILVVLMAGVCMH